jgi:DNA topoisomerase-1
VSAGLVGGAWLYGSTMAAVDASSLAESDGRASARAAGLRYSATSAGHPRQRSGRVQLSPSRWRADPIVRSWRGFGRWRSHPWTDVWICPDASGHQATGRDAKGRKQYRYHRSFREIRESTKYEHMMEFAHALPGIREKVREHMALRGLPREKVLAAVVKLLELTLIRVGNDEYARLNRSFGLTTLKNRHATVSGTRVRFRFRGKSGRQHEVGIATDGWRGRPAVGPARQAIPHR